ncbi:MAG: MBL fold metallo-hydrolase [Anaerolineales bacterium]|nr:MBL fold metallo-hydrolase [Anaerolineales bacterium]
MEITWYGHSCFRIVERGMATVVTDPYDSEAVGYHSLKLKADIVTVSHDVPGHNFLPAVKGAAWEITGPGEYEIGGVFLTSISTGGKKGTAMEDRNIACVFDYDGINVVHLGNMQSVPNRTEIDALGTVDIALVPVGGGSSLTAAKAAETISMIEPGIVIPMHFKTPQSIMQLSGLNQFLKEMGLDAKVKPLETLKINKNGIPEETQVIVLQPA